MRVAFRQVSFIQWIEELMEKDDHPDIDEVPPMSRFAEPPMSRFVEKIARGCWVASGVSNATCSGNMYSKCIFL